MYTSKGNDLSCYWVNDRKRTGLIKGEANCEYNSTFVSISLNNGSSTSSSGSDTSSSTSGPSTSGSSTPNDGVALTPNKPSVSGGAIAGIVIGAIAVLVIIGMIIFWLRRRKGKTSSAVTTMQHEPRPGHHQLPLGGHHEKAELQASQNQLSELNSTTHPGLPSQPTTGAHQSRHYRKAGIHGEPHVAELSGTPYNTIGQHKELHGAPEEINTTGSSSAPGDTTGSETPFISHQGNGKPMSEAGDQGMMGWTGAPETEPSHSRAQSTRIPTPESKPKSNTAAQSTSILNRPMAYYEAVM